MSTAPRISVVIPTHNRSTLLAEALQSVANQTVDDWEAIVVDDASQPPVSPGFTADDRAAKIRVLRHDPSKGGPAAKNTGAMASQGEILTFLDDDDLYTPTYLERALDVLDRYPDIQVVFMGVAWFGTNAAWSENAYRGAMQKTLEEARGTEIEPEVLFFGEPLIAALLNRVPMAFQRPVVRRQAFEKIGGYRDGCLLWDCDWAIRAAMETPTALITEGLYEQRAGNQGFSSKKDRRLEHMLSGVEIKEYLLAKTLADHAGSAERLTLFRQSAADSWFDLAYHHMNEGALAASLTAWKTSQRHAFSTVRFKMLGKLLLKSLAPGIGKN
ncbi:MAG: glycosyltransferase family 2 protein [Gammaproteobacteria bacterium]|nr:glycosyltransferase family 2 protein [Gammaproteobacteria bacterium]